MKLIINSMLGYFFETAITTYKVNMKKLPTPNPNQHNIER